MIDITVCSSYGFVLHPLSNPTDLGKSPGKRPLLTGWQQLTKTPENINKYIQEGANIGLVCGKVSNVIIIDFDNELFVSSVFDGEVHTLKAHRTSGRGHIYFKYTDKIKASKHHDLGIEILSDGSNAVLPPSIHESGDTYQWVKADEPIIDIPEKTIQQLEQLFKIEAELKQYLSKCRTCFRDVLKRRYEIDFHGAEGREYMIAVCCDLKSVGAIEDHIRMFAKIIYENDYNEKTTIQEWNHIDASKTWKCDTLKAKLPSYLNPETCSKCEVRKKQHTENKTCMTCINLPKGGVGVCKKAQKSCSDTDDACEKYHVKIRNTTNLGISNEKINPEEIHLTDLGNAMRLRYKYGADIRYCFPYKSWLVWDLKIWSQDNKAVLESMARGVVLDLYEDAMNETELDLKKRKFAFALKSESNSGIKNMLSLSQSEPGIPILPDEFDKDKMLFNVQNGTIDLTTGILKPHTKTDMMTKISPVIYEKNTGCPIWTAFLDKIFAGNTEIIEYLQRKSGYILSGDTREEEFDEMYGGGGNGKSKFTGAIIYIMGDYHKKINIETIQAIQGTKKDGSAASSDVANLKGARLVTVSEPEKGTVLNEQRVKDWTGRDPITARHLYERPFTFYPEFKLWIYTNHKLRIKGTDNGIWRRVKLVPFEVTIPDEEADKNLDLKLREEAPGILNWMIEGCLKWQKDGLKVPESIIEATQEYREEQDSLSDFFSECCEIDKTYKVPFKWLFLTYRAYCKVMGIISQSHITFVSSLEDRKFKKVTRSNKGNIWGGLRLKLALEEKCNEISSGCGDMKSAGVQVMTQFLESFLNSFSYRDFIQTDTQPAQPTPFKETDNEVPQEIKVSQVQVTKTEETVTETSNNNNYNDGKKTLSEMPQIELINYCYKRILRDYGYMPLSPEGIELESRRLAIELEEKYPRVLGCVEQAVRDRDKGR
jgi:P4 family phage/plasmid primase-like protien